MTILKNKYTQLILVGFIFALISGSFGFLSYKKFMDSSKLEKIIVIIEVETNNSLLLEISKLTSNQKISQQIRSINKELYQSINYSLIRYQRDARLTSGCLNINSDLTDNSIFIETKTFSSENKIAMEKCLNTLFNLSFQRLKEKIIVNTNDEIIRASFKINQIQKYRDYEDEKIKKNFLDTESSTVNKTLQEQMCIEFQPIFTSLIDGKQFIVEKKDISSDDFLSNLTSIPEVFENLAELIKLSKECDNLNLKKEFAVNNILIESLFDTKEGLEAVNNILSDIDFQSVFKIEKLNVLMKAEQAYLTKQNLIISFSLLGFLFGGILVYQFRFTK
jgi:hypothetical protein